MPSPLSRRSTTVPLAMALGVGAAASSLCWLAYRLPPQPTSDLDQLVIGVRALAAGDDPYRAVAARQYYPLFYPLPALLVVAPVSAIPLEWARVAWAGISGFVFALAARRYGRGLAVAMLSAPFLNAIVLNQWSPLLTATALFPLLGSLWVAKPSVGAAFLVAFPTRRALIGTVLLLLTSIVLLPRWPAEWLATLHSSGARIPLLQPGGAILALGLLRWRRPEARLLVCLACVPQTIGLYETLPLFMIPQTRRQAYVLAVFSYLAAFGQALVFPRTEGMSLEQNLAQRWPFVLGLLYLPALVLLLSQQEPLGGPPRDRSSELGSSLDSPDSQ